MLSTEKLLEKYKKLILTEKFSGIDQKTVTDEMLKAVVEKGYMECPASGKTFCFSCGLYSRTKPESECPICFSEFKS